MKKIRPDSKKGFVISNQNEEFVSDFQETNYGDVTFWAKVPSLAKVFKSRGECRKVMRKLQSAKYDLWELGIVETPNNFLVTCQCSVKPPWF